jgi:hypothetical protein
LQDADGGGIPEVLHRPHFYVTMVELGMTPNGMKRRLSAARGETRRRRGLGVCGSRQGEPRDIAAGWVGPRVSAAAVPARARRTGPIMRFQEFGATLGPGTRRIGRGGVSRQAFPESSRSSRITSRPRLVTRSVTDLMHHGAPTFPPQRRGQPRRWGRARPARQVRYPR